MASSLTGNWVVDLERRIYLKVQEKLQTKYGSKKSYADLTVVYEDYNITDPKFPTVYIHALTPTENMRLLEAYDTVGVLYTVQVEVTDTDNYRCRNVAAAVDNIMKQMLFEAVSFPAQDNTEDTYRMIARYRRSIAKSESSL